MVEDFSTQFNVLYLLTKAWAGSPGHPVYIYIHIYIYRTKTDILFDYSPCESQRIEITIAK